MVIHETKSKNVSTSGGTPPNDPLPDVAAYQQSIHLVPEAIGQKKQTNTKQKKLKKVKGATAIALPPSKDPKFRDTRTGKREKDIERANERTSERERERETQRERSHPFTNHRGFLQFSSKDGLPKNKNKSSQLPELPPRDRYQRGISS